MSGVPGPPAGVAAPAYRPGGDAPPGGASSATRRATLSLTNRAPWSGGIVRWRWRSESSPEPVDVVVAIPARDEGARIARCLDACAHAASLSGLRVRLLVLVNGTSDDTAARALAWSARRRRPLSLLEIDFAPSLAHAGAARRLALDVARLGAAPETMLLTTDADARPDPAWVATNAARLHGGAALVCGRVTLDPDEAARLSARTVGVGAIEDRYRRASLELEHLIDPDPSNPWPHHGTASGASLALRARDLDAVGGVPLVPCGEDRALARAVRAAGLSVVHADDVAVEVSCRTRGRAAGGMADTLRLRGRAPDPPCDEALVPALELHARLLARARTRRAWRVRRARYAALRAEGADDALAVEEHFDRAWARLEERVTAAGRQRLHVEQLRRELPVLLSLLADAREAAWEAVGEATRSRASDGSASRAAPDSSGRNVVPIGETLS